MEYFVNDDIVSNLLGGSVRTAKTRRSLHGFVVELSTEESTLIQQLIDFAENNDFFESEFDDEDERVTYKKLHELACRLRQKLAVDELDGKEAADGERANLGEHITMKNGRPWWDVSEVRRGLIPFNFSIGSRNCPENSEV